MNLTTYERVSLGFMYSKEGASMSTWFWWFQWAESGEAVYRPQNLRHYSTFWTNMKCPSSTVHALVDPEVQLMISRDWSEQNFNPANFKNTHRLNSRILHVTSWDTERSVVVPWNGHRRHRTLLFWGHLKSVVYTVRSRHVLELLNKTDLAVKNQCGHAVAGVSGSYI